MSDKLILAAYELTQLCKVWEYHRLNCHNPGNVTLAYADGGGLGIRVLMTCACGSTDRDIFLPIPFSITRCKDAWHENRIEKRRQESGEAASRRC